MPEKEQTVRALDALRSMPGAAEAETLLNKALDMLKGLKDNMK